MSYKSNDGTDPDRSAKELPGILEKFILDCHAQPFCVTAEWKKAVIKLMALAEKAKGVTPEAGDDVYMAILEELEPWTLSCPYTMKCDLEEVFTDLGYDAESDY